jgi:predicted nucleic acid-binding protein
VTYVDASAVLRILFREKGPQVPLGAERVVSSQLVAIETFRAVDRERLLGHADDVQTATKRKELGELRSWRLKRRGSRWNSGRTTIGRPLPPCRVG